MRKSGWRALALGWLAVAAIGLAHAGSAMAADPFYKGKKISFVVGYSPGGGSDTMCRMLARHYERFIAGKPSVIVRNMPGSGGVTAMNYVGKSARTDGTEGICGTVNSLPQMLDDPGLQTDLRKLQMVLGSPIRQFMYIRNDAGSGIKSADDFFKTGAIVMGGLRVTSSKDLTARLAMDMLGVKYKYVTGFRGDNQARAAVQQGIINTYLEAGSLFGRVTIPTMIKTGKATVVFQSGLLAADGTLTKRDALAPDAPTVKELYIKRNGKAPSGRMWESYKRITVALLTSARIVALPGGAPAAAVAALRDATERMKGDARFKADAFKAMRTEFKPIPGAEAEKAFREALAMSKDSKQFLKDYVAKGQAMLKR